MSSTETLERPLLHRLIAAGHLRYWIIASWALALSTTTSWRTAGLWFAVATVVGLLRTHVEGRLRGDATPFAERTRLFVSTLSCVVWAVAPLESFMRGGLFGGALAVGLLIAGYVLVFTQMRAAPREALIVSAPYSVVVVLLVIHLWGSPGFWVVLGILPVLALALLIKVVITQMKDAELSAINQRQAVLIAELEVARDQANAANAAKSNFLGVISHELRTPMNGVLGAAQLLRMSELTERQAGFVDIITQSGEGLMVLLNDILDLTKIEAGRMELEPVLVDVDDLVDRLIGPFAAQAEAKGLIFVRERTGEWPCIVRADPLRLAQISHNLLSNAIKFTAEGTVRFLVEGARTPDDRLALRISVADSGIGISPEDQARLFQPFTQVDDSSTRRFGGTGLGLTICQRLSERMGGRITVESRAGQGATFTLTVCLDAPEWAGVLSKTA